MLLNVLHKLHVVPSDNCERVRSRALFDIRTNDISHHRHMNGSV